MSRVSPGGNASKVPFWTGGKIATAVIVVIVVAVFIGVMTGVITKKKDATKCDADDFGPASYAGSTKVCWRKCTGIDVPIPGDNFHCLQMIGSTPTTVLKSPYNHG